jgi:hypothetical protein
MRFSCLLMGLLVMGAIASMSPVDHVVCAAKKKSQSNNRGKSQQAQAAKRRAVQHAMQDAKARVAAAQRARAIASQQAAMSQAKGMQAVSGANRALADLEAARSDAAVAAQALDDLEQEILASPSDGSVLNRYGMQLDEAQRQFDAARDAVLNSAAFKRDYERARLSGDGLQLASVRQHALDNNEEHKAAKRAYEAAKALYEPARIRALHAHPQWERTVAESRDARRRVAEAEQALKNALVRRASAAASYRQAATVGSAAQANIEQGSQQVKRLSQQQKSLNQSKNRSKSGGSRSK